MSKKLPKKSKRALDELAKKSPIFALVKRVLEGGNGE